MPNRIIRDGILTSENVDKLGVHAEVFYRRLMSVVDDFGRYTAHPSLLRAACYPLRVDSIREADISRFLTEVQEAGLIALYEVDGKRYLQMNKCDEPRAKKSKYPPMPASANICAQTQTNVPYSYSYSESYSNLHTQAQADSLTFPQGPSAAHKRFRDAYPNKIKPKATDAEFSATVLELVGSRGMTDEQAENYLIGKAEAYATSPAGMPPPPGTEDDFRPSGAEWLKNGRYDEPYSVWMKPNVRSNRNGNGSGGYQRGGKKAPTESVGDGNTIDIDAIIASVPITRSSEKSS